MTNPELGPVVVVGHNVDCKVEPIHALNHLLHLEEIAREAGAPVVLALNEVTSSLYGSEELLLQLLRKEGYAVAYSPTSYYRGRRAAEGIALASRQPSLREAIELAQFTQIRTHVAQLHKAENWKKREREHYRQLGTAAVNGLEISTAHLSFYAPPSEERHKFVEAMTVTPVQNKAVIFDGNTALNKTLIRMLQAKGFVDLRDEKQATTFVLYAGRIRVPIGRFRLDHSIVSRDQYELGATMEIADGGESDHSATITYLPGISPAPGLVRGVDAQDLLAA